MTEKREDFNLQEYVSNRETLFLNRFYTFKFPINAKNPQFSN